MRSPPASRSAGSRQRGLAQVQFAPTVGRYRSSQVARSTGHELSDVFRRYSAASGFILGARLSSAFIALSNSGNLEGNDINE